MKKALTVSIIIPAYNEERHLATCLESIALQTVRPEEVIVVDNNSTDKTAEIAKSFNFVKLVTEKKQGLIPARNLGFDIATGDILGRINADAILDNEWVKITKEQFVDGELAGLTGPALAKLLPILPWGYTTVWSRIYLLASKAYFRLPVMWGANMAIRKTVWMQIKPMAQTDDSIVHEDQDLSVLLAIIGKKVAQVNQLRIRTHEQSYFYWPKFREYYWRRHQTRRLHRRQGSYNKIEILPWIKTAPVSVIMLLPTAAWALTSLLSFPIVRLYRSLVD